MLDHFSHSELACPTTDQVRLAARFGETLERLRVELDAPMHLNSACRSPMHNAKVRGHPRSRTGRAKRLVEITAYLDTLGDDELDRRLRQYQRTSGRLRMDKTNNRRRGR